MSEVITFYASSTSFRHLVINFESKQFYKASLYVRWLAKIPLEYTE